MLDNTSNDRLYRSDNCLTKRAQIPTHGHFNATVDFILRSNKLMVRCPNTLALTNELKLYRCTFKIRINAAI